MSEYIKEVLKEFLEEVTIEEINHLKFTMGEKEIGQFLEMWISENLKDLPRETHPKKTSSIIPVKRKTITLTLESITAKVTIDPDEFDEITI